MRAFAIFLIGLVLVGQAGLAAAQEGAEKEELSFPLPATLEVLANGLNCVSFVVKLKGLPPEAEEYFKYSMKGPPAEVPLFDQQSKLFFWRPRPEHAGIYKYEFVAEDPTGRKFSRSVTIKALKAPTLEALPQGWEEMKKEDKYLLGRQYLPSTNYIEMDIAAVPGYELEVTVLDSTGQECTLKYVPKEGRPQLNKARRLAVIRLGGKYSSDKVKKVRRDLYEDLYATLGLIFRNIQSVDLKGAYILDGFSLYDRAGLVGAAQSWDISAPNLNLSFDGRFYESGMYSKKEPMMIADAPTIKIEFNTSSGLIWRRGRLVIDETEYHAARNEFSLVVVKPGKDASSFDVNYVMYMLRIPSARKLPFGEHYFLFETENAFGMCISQEAYARVVTIPAQVVGKPVVFPSPFSPGIHSELSIQYELSMQTNIELAVFGVDGTAVMRRRFFMGDEGARKGKNTVRWEGKTDAGFMLSNGIYTGVIIDRDENRVLEKFKIAVYR